MLERSDPDHFARRPNPAFRPKQAQALGQDIAAILNTEIDNPFLLRRVKKQIQHLIEYSIDGVVSVERTDRQLRAVMREIDELERRDEKRSQAAYDGVLREPLQEPPTSANAASASPASARSATASTAKADRSSERKAQLATGAPKSGPTNAPQLDPEIADSPVTWDDMTKVLQQLRDRVQNANGKPAAAPAKAPPTDAQPSPKPSPPTG